MLKLSSASVEIQDAIEEQQSRANTVHQVRLEFYFHSFTSSQRSVSAPLCGLWLGDLMPAQLSSALRDILAANFFQFSRAWRDDGEGLWHNSCGESRLCINRVQVNATSSCYTEWEIKGGSERVRERARERMRGKKLWLLMDDDSLHAVWGRGNRA